MPHARAPKYVHVNYEAADKSFLGEVQVAYVSEDEDLSDLFERIAVLQNTHRIGPIPVVPMTITISLE